MTAYTFLSARFANDDATAVVAITEEVAAVAISASDTPEQWHALLQSGVPIAPYERRAGDVEQNGDALRDRQRVEKKERALSLLAQGKIGEALKETLEIL